MAVKTFVFGAVSVAASPPSVLEWEDWKVAFGMQFDDEEEAKRHEIYDDNVRHIRHENAQNLSHTFGVNQFTHLREFEFIQRFTGLSRRPPTDLPSFSSSTELQAPTSMDWTSVAGVVNPIKDQGQCGSCWAFSAVGTLESGYALAKGSLYTLAEQQQVDCDTAQNQGCNGGWPDWALDYYVSNGVCSEASYPYTAQDGTCKQSSCSMNIAAGMVSGYGNFAASDAGLVAGIVTQPISVTVAADSAFQMYSSGILAERCKGQINHAVIAVGYDTDYFKIRNSWGTSWGEAGYIRIGRGNYHNGAFCLWSYAPVVQTFSSSQIAV